MKTVLLAAGSSRRMAGRDKLLEIVEGLPLLRRQALAILSADIGPVAITLSPDRAARREAIADLAVTILSVPDAGTGMSASLRAAAVWAHDQPLMVCPADMPDLTAEDFAAMASAYRGAPLRATDCGGRAGHPVVFPPELLPMFTRLTGDEGARSILRAHPPDPVALPDRHATTDLDTPEDWEAWRAALTYRPSTR